MKNSTEVCNIIHVTPHIRIVSQQMTNPSKDNHITKLKTHDSLDDKQTHTNELFSYLLFTLFGSDQV